MWLIFFIPLAVAAASEIINEDCNLPTHRVCSASDLPQSFPRTSEELDDFCGAFTKFLRCTIDVEERCQFESETIELSNAILSTVNDVCDKDTALHEVIENNLQCVGEFLEARTGSFCFFMVHGEEQIRKRLEALVDNELVNSENEHNLRECLPSIQSLACFAMEMEKSCGEDMQNAFVEIIRKTAVTAVDGCSEEIDEFLPAVVTLHKLEANNEEEVD